MGTVRIGHGDKPALLPEKGPVFGVQPGPVFSVKGGELLKGEGGPCLPGVEVVQHRDILLRQNGLQGDADVLRPQPGQLEKGVHIPAGGPLQLRVGAAGAGQISVGGLGVPEGIPQPGPQAGVSLRLQTVKHLVIGGQGPLPVPTGRGVQQLKRVFQHGGVQQGAEGGQPPQLGAQKNQIHGSSSLSLHAALPQF